MTVRPHSPWGSPSALIKGSCQAVTRTYLAVRERLRPLAVQERRVRPWRAINGDATLRLEYDLDAAALVFDVGGYKGDWTTQISAKYDCTVHVFEPVPSFASAIRSRVHGNDKIHVHAFGLAGSTRTEHIGVDADRSSVLTMQRKDLAIQLMDIVEFIDSHQIQEIHLLKINIEGGEYELLDRLLRSAYVARVRDIQVQFHDFVANAERQMRSIQEGLARTHRLTYQFPFVWENWRRLDAPRKIC